MIDKTLWPDSRLLDLLGIDVPIIQAPMAGSSSTEMAIEVGKAGGLGSIACAALDAPAFEDELSSFRQQSNRPVNVNFFAHDTLESDKEADQIWLKQLAPYYEELGIEAPGELDGTILESFNEDRCAVIEQLAPEIVSFHFGLPEDDLVQRVKAAGSKIISTATTVEEARWLEQHGCDAIIAQGYEAGGHRGMFLSDDIATQVGTLSLVPQICDAVSVPVIAAGGIADGRGIAAAFALGASGVQLGTAFLFTDEATLSKVYDETLRTNHSTPTSFSNVFSGRPARCIMNRVMVEQGPMSIKAPAFPKGVHAISALKKGAEGINSRDFSAHYSGQSGPLGITDKAVSARQLTEDLAADAIKRLQGLTP